MRSRLRSWKLVAALFVPFSFAAAVAQEAPPKVIPAPSLDVPGTARGSQQAVLAGGCYWGTQGIFEHVKGVERVIAGFSGGYSDADGAAEAVKITFDPRVISYGKLLQIFFSVVHDPTELNRQGPDIGVSYRSAIYYMNAAQQRVAQAYVARLERADVFPARIVTRIDPLKAFHPAVSSQQNYMVDHPNLEYILVNDAPKLRYLKQYFPDYYLSAANEYRPASSMLLSGQ